MKFNKEKFLKTEVGSELEATVRAIDYYIEKQSKTPRWGDPVNYRELQDDIDRLFAQLEVFKLVIRQFYGLEYFFTRTDEYYGLTTSDESDWLFRIERS